MNDISSHPAEPQQITKRSLWQKLVEPTNLKNEEDRRQSRLLLTILIVLIPLTANGIIFPMIGGTLAITDPFAIFMIGFMGLMTVTYVVGRTGRYKTAAWMLIILLSVMPYIAVAVRNQYTALSFTGAFSWLIVPILLASVYLTARVIFIIGTLEVIGLILIALFIPAVTFNVVLGSIGFVTVSTVFVSIVSRQRDLLEKDRETELTQRNLELQTIRVSLEERVAQRTQRLIIAATISERLSAILNLDELMDEVVNQIKENFAFYHAHIYLFDEDKENLVVAAGTGIAGAEMKAQRHKIALSAVSLVARSARSGEVVRVNNVRTAEDWLPNPLLPNTYSEMAVPIMLKDKVVGVLDVQEDKIGGLSEDDASILRNLANQVAVTMNNAQLFEEVEAQLTQAQALQERYIEQTWDRSRITRSSAGRVQYSPESTTGLNEAVISYSRQQAMAQAEPTTISLNGENALDLIAEDDVEHSALVAPISLRNIIIGNLQLHGFDLDKDWTEAELALINTVIDQVAQTAETLRLFEETQERAARERLISDVSNKMRRAGDMETLMKVTVDEITEALGANRTFIRLRSEDESTNSQVALPAETNGQTDQ